MRLHAFIDQQWSRRLTLSRAAAGRSSVGLVLLAWFGAACAQDIEPRAFSNAPVGMNFLIAGYAYTQGGLAFDPSLPVKTPELQTQSGVFAYARAVDWWGKSGKVDVTLPYTWLSGTADYDGQTVSRDVAGFADPRFRLSVNLYGAPALGPREFLHYQQDLIIGASLQVTAPVGQYDDRRLVNIGTNRWSIKPEVGLSKALGRWTLEAAAAASFYSDNEDFFGGHELSKEPIFSVQEHAIYSLGGGRWASLDATYFSGGETTLDAVQRNDLQENWRVGGTLAIPVDASNSVKFYASSGVSARTGNSYDLYGVAWQYRWLDGSRR
jgi:hypothetical protein